MTDMQMLTFLIYHHYTRLSISFTFFGPNIFKRISSTVKFIGTLPDSKVVFNAKDEFSQRSMVGVDGPSSDWPAATNPMLRFWCSTCRPKSVSDDILVNQM